jgi:hypothetical protein
MIPVGLNPSSQALEAIKARVRKSAVDELVQPGMWNPDLLREIGLSVGMCGEIRAHVITEGQEVFTHRDDF